MNLYREATEHDEHGEFRDVVPVPGPAYQINFNNVGIEEPEAVAHLILAGVLVEIGDGE